LVGVVVLAKGVGVVVLVKRFYYKSMASSIGPIAV